MSLTWCEKKRNSKKKARSITNTDIEAVFAAEYFAFYKGTPVIRINSSNGGSFAIMGFIFLNHSYDKYDYVTQEQLLNHEYGHILQQKELGHDKYIIAVAIPSVTFFSLQGNNDWIVENYYNLPWEYDADIRGGVVRDHARWASPVSEYYMDFGEILRYV